MDKFLWCCNNNLGSNKTGGTYDVTLTVDNLPSHNHVFTEQTATGQIH